MASVSDEITSDKLIDLRVVDLRSELEKRGLDKTGVKAVLLERLEKALKSEEQNRKNTEGRNEEKSDLSDLVKIETLSEEKRQEENQSEDKIEHTTENMDEKESDTSNMALVDVFLNINNPDIDPLLPDKTSGEDLAEDQLLSSDTKPSDMLVNDTFDKDQFVEELPITVTALDTNKDNSTVLQEESDDPLKDTGALPEQSSSSTEANTKEENSGKSSSASVRIATPPLNSKDEVVVTALSDSLPPTPTSVPRKAPFALKGTVGMDTSTTQQSEENESLIVHVDDTQNDLDADLVASKTNKAKMDKASKDKVSGKTEVKKTDGSTVEGRAKGKTEGGQTEKKADEKKDVKSKSSSVYESKFAKNVKSNNQNSRNLRVRGFARYTSVADLRTIFAKYGKVVNVKIVGKTHCAVVTMSKPAEALKCSMWLNQTIVNGMKLTVVREVRQIKHKTRNIKVREKRSKNFRVTLKIQKELEQKQRAETIRLDKVRERLRFEKMKLEKEKLSRYRMEKELLEIERHNVEMRCAEMLRIEEMTRSMQRPLDRGNPHEEGLWDDPKRPRMLNSRNPSRFERPFKNEPWLEKMKLEKEKLSRYRMEKELLEIERHNVEMHCDEMLRMEEMTRSMQRPLDRGNPHEEGLWDDPKRPGMFNSRNPSRFERPFKNEPCYNRYEEPDYGRPIERFDRRKSRNIGSHFDEYKEREMRRKIDLFRDIRVRVDRRHNDRFLSDDNLNRMPSDFRRDMGPSGEPDRRYIGSDRGRDIDRQTIPAHERLGRVRSSPVGGPDQRSPWGSGSINKKVDNWSHMHGDMGNSGMNRFNEPWHGNPMDKTGRDASGAFVVSGKPGNSGGMGQNMGPGNMFGNSQSQGGIMMNTYSGGNFGGNNMSGHIQQPRFNA